MAKIFEVSWIKAFRVERGKNLTASFVSTTTSTSGNIGKTLMMTNCIAGKRFYCDPNDGANGYFRVLYPTKYGLPDKKLYIYLNNTSPRYFEKKLVDDPFATKTEEKKTETTKATTTTTTTTTKTQETTKQSISDGADDGSYYIKSANGVMTSGKVRVQITEKESGEKIAKEGAVLKIPPNEYSYGSVVRTSYLNDYDDIVVNDKNLSMYNIIKDNFNVNISSSTLYDLKELYISKFNRFKVAHPDLELSKSFAHVFFTRPELNIYEDPKGAKTYSLATQTKHDPLYYYLDKQEPEILLSLTKYLSPNHSFIPLLGNMCTSLEISDEYIKDTETSETYTGHKIKYGKHNIDSRVAGNISIGFKDDTDYRVYKIHKAWVDYIHKCYRGEFKPIEDLKRYRTLDYATAIYFFLCGPDGETILFWSKYTGVFPTTIPSAVNSWSKGSMVKLPEFSISYDYSWKEDFNPFDLTDFNRLAKIFHNESKKEEEYTQIYEPEIGSTGKSFVGAPYVEAVKDAGSEVAPYVFKLRYRPLVQNYGYTHKEPDRGVSAVSTVAQAAIGGASLATFNPLQTVTFKRGVCGSFNQL